MKGLHWDVRGPRHSLMQSFSSQTDHPFISLSIQSVAKALEPEFWAVNPSSATHKLCDLEQIV